MNSSKSHFFQCFFQRQKLFLSPDYPSHMVICMPTNLHTMHGNLHDKLGKNSLSSGAFLWNLFLSLDTHSSLMCEIHWEIGVCNTVVNMIMTKHNPENAQNIPAHFALIYYSVYCRKAWTIVIIVSVIIVCTVHSVAILRMGKVSNTQIRLCVTK